MKKYKDFIFFMFVIVMIITLIATYLWIAGSIISKIGSEKKQLQNNLGKNIVIQGDTLEIIDYNRFLETYTLSNGAKCEIEYINKKFKTD